MSTDEMRERIDAALQDSMDDCARCKACDTQTDAVMRVVDPELARLREELARVTRLRDEDQHIAAFEMRRADALEAVLARVRELPKKWAIESSTWYRANRHTHPNGIDYACGFEDGWDHAADQLAEVLASPATQEGTDGE